MRFLLPLILTWSRKTDEVTKNTPQRRQQRKVARIRRGKSVSSSTSETETPTGGSSPNTCHRVAVEKHVVVFAVGK